ncbi:SwmB domain-containing protein [Verminephrobacter aporrectodeae]|uniref:SwmB domain-containing protein n=1 Tax=Verminephrobacter aporrectodeae TaxID=1110389 RepID=UPI0003181FA3|nr:SwmB domain-containing protein [Verminephrobacter aporrectodeae]
MLSSATVTGNDLVLTYTEASSLGLDATNTAPAAAYAVSSASGVAIAVDSAAVNATAKTVTLRLNRAVDSGEAVSLNYTRPATGNDVLQDAAGNDAANLTNQAVSNGSAADTTAPVLGSATVSGRDLVLSYTEVSSLGLDAANPVGAAAFAVSSASGVAISVESVTVGATTKTVTLHLSRDVDSTEAVSMSYTKPATGNVLQDVAGNDADSLTNQAVINGSAADTTAPVLSSATVSGHDLVLTYTEASSLGLDAVHTAPVTAYAVSSASGVAISVESVTVNATAKTVTLRLNRSVDSSEALSLNYTRPATGNDVLQDVAGNDATKLTNQAVTNNSAADTTAPCSAPPWSTGTFCAELYRGQQPGSGRDAYSPRHGLCREQRQRRRHSRR